MRLYHRAVGAADRSSRALSSSFGNRCRCVLYSVAVLVTVGCVSVQSIGGIEAAGVFTGSNGVVDHDAVVLPAITPQLPTTILTRGEDGAEVNHNLVADAIARDVLGTPTSASLMDPLGVQSASVDSPAADELHSAALHHEIMNDTQAVVVEPRENNIHIIRMLAEEAAVESGIEYSVQFAIKPSVCRISPDPKTFPTATHFVIDCPKTVDAVDVKFFSGDETGAKELSSFGRRVRAAKIYDTRGNRVTQATIVPPLNAHDGLVSKRFHGCAGDYNAKSCQVYDFDVIRADGRPPVLQSLRFSNSLTAPPAFNASSFEYSVQLYANEPVTVSALAGPDYFVDYRPPLAQRRAVEHHCVFPFTPRVPAGTSTSFKVYVTNRARTQFSNYTVNVDAVTSVDPRIHLLSLEPGRLEPVFHANSFSYLARVPEGTRKIKLDIDALNQKDTICEVEGVAMPIQGKGEVEVDFESLESLKTITIDCRAEDSTHTATYVVRVVPQSGGTTLLKSLRIVGAQDPRPAFQPLETGPYHFDLQADGQDQSWVAFQAVPQNSDAVVEVDGVKVDASSFVSPFFRVRLGEKKRFNVMVSTLSNPFRETYFVDVDRSGKWFEDYRASQRWANYLGWASTLFSSTRASHFLQNANFLQYVSASSRLNGLPSTYMNFAAALNKFNLQFASSSLFSAENRSSSVSGGDFNFTAVPAKGDHGLVINRSELTSVPLELASLYAEDEQLVDISDTVGVETTHAFNALAVKSRSSSGDSSGAVELYDEFKDEDAQKQVTLLVKRVLLDTFAATEVTTPDRTFFVAPARMLEQSENSLAMRRKIVNEVDALFNDYNKFTDFSASVVFTTLTAITLGFTYLILWVSVLQGNSAAVPGFRQDIVSFLHPARFWSFVLDYSLISYSQALLGLTIMSSTGMRLLIAGKAVNTAAVVTTSVLMVFAFPLTFLAISGLLLWRLKDELVHSHSFRYTDKSTSRVKAFQRWCQWVPILHNFLSIEVSAAAPIEASGTENSLPIVFEEDASIGAGCLDGDTAGPEVGDMQGTSPGASQGAYQALLGSSDKMKYRAYDESVRVDLNLEEYRRAGYQTANSRVLSRYPKASIGKASYIFKNVYETPIKANVNVELRHLDVISKNCKKYPLWVSRDGLELPAVDHWHLFFAKAPRDGLFYWLVERTLIFSLIFFMSCYRDITGVSQTLLWLFGFLVPCGIFFQSSLAGGVSRWHHNLLENSKKKKLRQAMGDAQVEKLKVWPFSDFPAAKGAYLARRIKKRHAQVFGMHGLLSKRVEQPYQTVVTDPFWLTRIWGTVVEFALGPVGQGVMKALTLFIIILGNKTVGAVGNVSASIMGIMMTSLACILLNIPAWKDFSRLCCCFYYEMRILTRRAVIYCSDIQLNISRFNEKLTSVASASSVGLKNLHSSMLRSRHIDVQEVALVQPNFGIYMTGSIKQTREQKLEIMQNRELLRMNPTREDARIDKVLVVNGTLGASRLNCDREMPIQFSTQQFLQRTAAGLGRCVATVQIVNHSAYRFPLGVRNHSCPEQDSYISLFTDPVLCPEFGKIRSRHKYHGYTIRYDRIVNDGTIIITGPAIKAGCEYRLTKSGDPRPKRSDSCRSDQSSIDSREFTDKPERVTSTAFATQPGRLLLHAPGGREPDLEELFEVDPPQGDGFDIDPLQVTVRYDRSHRTIQLSHRNFSVNHDQYTVTWTAKSKNLKQIDVTATASRTGELRMEWKNAEVPDMSQMLFLQDFENDTSFQIDPRDTDAHEMLLPANRFTGGGRWFYSAMSFLGSPFNAFSTNELQSDILIETLPCTVVQCVDPIEQIYRVEPNFQEGVKRLRAKFEETTAMKEGINLQESLSKVALSVMSQEEYVNLWGRHKVPITGDGFWFDPLLEPSHNQLRGKQKDLRNVEGLLRVEVSRRLEIRLQKIRELVTQLTAWSVAYTSPDLRAAVAARDEAEWEGDERGVKDYARQLAALKGPYERSVPNFVFPMHVHAKQLSKRAKLGEQMKQWEGMLKKWLVECEAASSELVAGSSTCAENITAQVMSSLRKVLFKPEDLPGGRLRTVLHYMTDSRQVRGGDPEWKPDPLAGTQAMVRLWRANSGSFTDGVPASSMGTTTPVWLPCSLKLEGDRILINFSNDFAKEKQTQYFWRTPKTWAVPLGCFETVTVGHDPTTPPGGDQQMFRNMTTRLTFRKAQRIRVKDDFAVRLEDDAVDNAISAPDGEVHRLLIGRTVHHSAVDNYSRNEIDSNLTVGDEVNVHPLLFRIFGTDQTRWANTVKNSFMDRKPREVNMVFDPRAISSKASTIIEPAALPEPDEESSADYVTSEESENEISSEPTEPTASIESVEPPPPKAHYRGDWVHSRFHGWGKLYDATGKLVYDGQWKNGKRWGRGTCYFKDRRDLEWMYDGFFIDDEMCGGGYGGRKPGVLRLVDEREIERLKAATDRDSGLQIVAFEGTFRMPRRVRRSKSADLDRDKINFSPETLRRLFQDDIHMGPRAEKRFLQTGEDEVVPDYSKAKQTLYHLDTETSSSDSDVSSASRRDVVHRKKVVIDLRRTFSSPGDEMLIGRPLEVVDQLVAAEGKGRAGPYAEGSVDSSMSGADGQQRILLEDEYLPHRSKWTRLLDPTLGYWGLARRFRQGTVTFANGSKYHGQLKDGRPSGVGFLSCNAGGFNVKYQGEWVDGRPGGRGVLVDADSDSYWGRFQEGKRDGRGAFVGRGGLIHMKGFWKDDKLHGGNCVVNVDASISREFPYLRYVGTMENSLPHGKGKMTWDDGVVYVGNFNQGRREGFGTIIDKKGQNAYVGNWSDDMPHGRAARLLLPDGKVYSGQMARGQRQGMGELFASAEKPKIIYEGCWRNDLPDGSGTSYGSDGNYTGDWKQGKRNGKGFFEYTDQRVYQGDFKNDFPEGKGSYKDEGGAQNVYQFAAGEVVQASLQAYKKQSLGRNTKMASSQIFAHDPDHWGRRRNIKPEQMLPLHATGREIWLRFANRPFTFVNPAEALPLGDPPQPKVTPGSVWNASFTSSSSSSS